ncbi:hypothetical protein B7494_g1568 [Chlorociboria aeruginascens]|nr:hypothetical protein B7494_g1568 [Chlorociboria aeruginascens]
MPPRIPSVSRLGTASLCFRPVPLVPNGTLPKISVANLTAKALRQKYRNPYDLVRARERARKNNERKAVLTREREEVAGDPIRGITTPFVESFDTVGGSSLVTDVVTTSNSPEEGIQIRSANDALLNHFLSPSELKTSIDHSFNLTQPVSTTFRDFADPAVEAEKAQAHIEGHARATAALARIVSLANSSQKDKTRANIQRCIETFGRHRTDGVLRPRAPTSTALKEKTPSEPQLKARAGPDTGSSEVQIAILTAKIRVLANAQEAKKGKKDKINKRNLRVLVHKRQKLLKYLRVKERGSDRWQNLISTLGLTERTWKDEISF